MIKTFTQAQKGLMLTEHFCVGDFWAFDGFASIKLDTDLAIIWEAFLARFGVRPRLRNANHGTDKPYAPQPSAGYRDSKHLFGGSRGSAHCKGNAVDFEIPDIPAGQLAQYAETLGLVGAVGHYYTTKEDVDKCEHIHVDLRDSRKLVRWGHQNKTSGCNIPTFGGLYACIAKGHQGYGVRKIQQRLNADGARLIVDGAFGSATHNALKAWQRNHGLAADGKYGRATNAKMQLFEW